MMLQENRSVFRTWQNVANLTSWYKVKYKDCTSPLDSLDTILRTYPYMCCRLKAAGDCTAGKVVCVKVACLLI